MELGEPHQVGQPRHGAVVVHDLAQPRRPTRSRPNRAMSTAASVWPAAHQHPAVARHQGKHMAGRHDIVAAFARVDRHGDRPGAIGRGDAGRDAFARLDRHREGGLVARAVMLRHQGQPELFDAAHATSGRQIRPRPYLAMEIDRLGGDAFRRNDQIALVLAILVIDQDDELALPGIGDDLLDRETACPDAIPKGWRPSLKPCPAAGRRSAPACRSRNSRDHRPPDPKNPYFQKYVG